MGFFPGGGESVCCMGADRRLGGQILEQAIPRPEYLCQTQALQGGEPVGQRLFPQVLRQYAIQQLTMLLQQCVLQVLHGL